MRYVVVIAALFFSIHLYAQHDMKDMKMTMPKKESKEINKNSKEIGYKDRTNKYECIQARIYRR